MIYVDTEAVAGEEGGSIAEATDHNQDGSFEKNVVYVVDTDSKDQDELLVLFVDTNNELKGTEPVVKTTVSAEGVLTVDEVLPTTSSTIYPVAENVEKLTGEDINTVNDGLFNGFNLESLDGKSGYYRNRKDSRKRREGCHSSDQQGPGRCVYRWQSQRWC